MLSMAGGDVAFHWFLALANGSAGEVKPGFMGLKHRLNRPALNHPL